MCSGRVQGRRRWGHGQHRRQGSPPSPVPPSWSFRQGGGGGLTATPCLHPWYRGGWGQIDAGVIAVGDAVLLMPGNLTASVKGMRYSGGGGITWMTTDSVLVVVLCPTRSRSRRRCRRRRRRRCPLPCSTGNEPSRGQVGRRGRYCSRPPGRHRPESCQVRHSRTVWQRALPS